MSRGHAYQRTTLAKGTRLRMGHAYWGDTLEKGTRLKMKEKAIAGKINNTYVNENNSCSIVQFIIYLLRSL